MSNFGQGGIMRSNQPLFTVKCEKIGKRAWYKVSFPPNNQINERIKLSSREHHRWSLEDHCWHLHTKALYDLIKSYRKSDKIKFEFGEEGRVHFLEEIKKIDQLLEIKQDKIQRLKKKNEEALAWKKELEEHYQEYEPEVLKYLKSGTKLYPHQVVAIMFLKKVINGLLSLQMGLGKTICSIGYSEMMGFKKILVITPNSLKFNYQDEVKKFTDSKSHIIYSKSQFKNNKKEQNEAKYIIVNYDYFNNKDHKKVKTKYDDLNLGFIECVVLDECFPYDTLIHTDRGLLKIGDIVENAIDCKIISYNHKIKKLETKTILRYLYNGKKPIMRVKLSNNKIIECTENHKFYSNGNYIEAKNLKHGDKLWVLSEEFQTKEKDSKILFEEMQYEWNERNIQNKKRENQIKIRSNFRNGYKEMCGVWNEILNKKKNNKKILWNKMFGHVENETTTNKRKNIYQGSGSKNSKNKNGIFKKSSRSKFKTFNTNETKKSHAQSRNCGENETKKDWSNIFIERWKWALHKTTIKFILQNFWINRNAHGIRNPHKEPIKKNEHSKYYFTSESLQIRHWYAKIKNWCRNRWKHTQNQKMEISGQKKRRDIEIIWVESIEVLEQRDRSKHGECDRYNQKVYDLEVEDNHNYFANNILVSNCHMIKNTQSNTYKNIKKLIKDIPSKVFLSGTPAPNRTKELYTVLNLISPLDFPTKTEFYEQYCGLTYIPKTKNDDPENDESYHFSKGWQQNEGGMRLEELYHKIAPYTYRKRKFEVLKDLPDKIYQKILIEMTDEEKEQYDKIEEGVANEIFSDQEMSSVNILTIMLRLRQYTSMLKIKPTVELAKRLHEEGEKSVIVDMFKPPIAEMKKILGDIAGLHTGDEDEQERNVVKNDFQNPSGQTKVFLASISTTKYGLTLTAASKLFMTTLPWSTGEYDQVSDRLHRIGQKDTVFIYPIIIKDTIDEYVFSMIEKKRIEITKVLDNEDYESNVEESVLSEVLEMLRKKYGKKTEDDGKATK